MAAVAVSHVYPLGSRLNERGRLEVGGCDVVELAREFGTPGLRLRRGRHPRPGARLRRGLPRAHRALRGGLREQGVPVHGRLPAAGRGGAVRATSPRGGELHLALAGGFAPERIYMHGNNKSQAELDYALEAGVGHIVVDSFDEIERLSGRGAARVMLRVTPGIKPTTHSYIQTGQEDSKFGFGARRRAARASTRARDAGPRAARPARAHRLAGLRAGGVREARRGAGGHRRLPAAQPGRRARHRLHARRAAAARSRSTWRRCCAARPTA